MCWWGGGVPPLRSGQSLPTSQMSNWLRPFWAGFCMSLPVACRGCVVMRSPPLCGRFLTHLGFSTWCCLWFARTGTYWEGGGIPPPRISRFLSASWLDRWLRSSLVDACASLLVPWCGWAVLWGFFGVLLMALCCCVALCTVPVGVGGFRFGWGKV